MLDKENQSNESQIDSSENSSTELPNTQPEKSGGSERAAPIDTVSNNSESELTAKRSRSIIGRIILSILLLGLVFIGYTQRARLSNLWKIKNTEATARSDHKPELKVLYWVDPMHPSYKSDKPGKAPDCGMDLTPVYEASAPTNLPEGAFQVSPEKQQMIGVQYGEASYQSASRTLRAVGRLAYDETKIVRFHPRIEGWIEEVFVDFTGKQVGKGQPLISIYSPELWQTQQEYLLALKGRNELASSPFSEAAVSSASLLEAARKRLELWDIDFKQLEQLEHTGKPFKAITLYAPSDGFILNRNAFPKQRVTPETELYAIANLSTIWVLADIYEYEAPEIKLGQPVNVTLPYAANANYRGKITYIYPQLDSTTRTLKVRIEVPNPNFRLKPDMYANVEINIDYGRRLVVPQEAVLDSGAEKTIFIARDGGYFEPRKVQTGAKVDKNIIILNGLKAGERIVTSANFLIDSESRLKSVSGGLGMPGMNHDNSGVKSKPVSLATPSSPAQKIIPQSSDHSQHQSQEGRKILYWYDPMHPSYKSDKPGIAPDCEMDLVPKYADEKKR